MATVGAVGTKSEFAAVIGRTKQYVSQLGRQGRLVLTSDGKVDFEASKRRIEETKRVDRQGVREHHARARRSAGIPPESSTRPPEPDIAPGSGAAAGEQEPPAPPAAPPESDQDAAAYNKARAQKEAAAAAMAEIALAQRRGELVERSQVLSMGLRIGGNLRGGFARIVPRIGPVWSTEQDPAKRERLLEAELNQILSELADGVAKLGVADE